MIFNKCRLLCSVFQNVNVFSKFVRNFNLKLPRVKESRSFNTSCKLNTKVVVCGSSGGIGQQLCLILKTSPLITELTLYDIKNCSGVAEDLSHIPTKVVLKHFDKITAPTEVLGNKDIVVVVAGKPRKEGMKRSELFDANVIVIKEIVDAMVQACSRAMLCIVTNPVNSLVPAAAEFLKKTNIYDPRKLFGVTTIDCARASIYASEMMCSNPLKTIVPVIGGHSRETIIPVFSQSSIQLDLPKDKIQELRDLVVNAGENVIASKENKAPAMLSVAYSTSKFIFSLCRAINGEEGIVECAFIQSDVTEAKYFANPLILGPMGVKRNLGYGKLTNEECCLMKTCVKYLIKEHEVVTKYLESLEKDQQQKKKK